jgi:hypothetical protein
MCPRVLELCLVKMLSAPKTLQGCIRYLSSKSDASHSCFLFRLGKKAQQVLMGQPVRYAIQIGVGKRKPRASHIPTARLLLLSSLQRPINATITVCATRYFPDLPTDSSEEATYYNE